MENDLSLNDAIDFFSGVGMRVLVFDENGVTEVKPKTKKSDVKDGGC